MKILVIADIHANWPALAAISETFDACLFLGDLVDYGTDPAPCIEWVQKHAHAAIRGNHDHAVAQHVTPHGNSGFRALAAATRPMNWDALAPRHMDYLRQLPVTRAIRLGGFSFYLVHGTPRDPLDEYLTDDPDAWRERLADVEADFVCVGHTHIPFLLDLGRTKVLNPGSVGQPRDGDPRCSYAVIENGRVSFHRVDYDIEATVRSLEQSGLRGDEYECAVTTLRNGRWRNGQETVR